MPYATLYDATTAGFDFKGLVPIASCAVVVMVLAAFALRNRGRHHAIRWLILGVAATVTVVAFGGVALEYRNYRLDVRDLEAGRAPFVEGVVTDHEFRHGGERFDVGTVRLHTRTSIGGYGMQPGAVTITDGLPVRIHFSLRARGRRHTVLRLAEPTVNTPHQ